MTISLFRELQNEQIKHFAEQLDACQVFEWGGSPNNNNKKFFEDSVEYILTVFDKNGEFVHEDLLKLSYSDDTIEAAICISVLQHVFDINKAISEIIRVLKPGGKCLITNGFIFPICMEQDYYRLTPAFWTKRLEDEPVSVSITPLGNMYHALDNILMRPYGQWNSNKSILNKLLSLPFKALRNFITGLDNTPLGIAVVITKL